MQDKLRSLEERFESFEREMARPEVAADFQKLQALAKERAAIEAVVLLSRALRKVEAQIEEAHAALQAQQAAAGRDLEAAQLELAEAQDARADLARQLDEARAALASQAQADEGRTDEWHDLTGDLESARQAAAVAEAEWRSRYDQLRDAAEQQIRTLELALREADNRAEMATLEVETIKRERKASAKDAARAPEPAATPHPVAAYEGPERQANRYPMAAEIEIQIDGNRAWLVDLSLTGAQVLSSGPLKPNRAVRFTLPFGEETISCKGKIVWSRIDSSRAGRLLYRAGVFFMTADRTALTTFLSRYGAA